MKRILCAAGLFVLAALAYFWFVEIPQQVRLSARTPLNSSPADLDIHYQDFTVTPADAAITLQGWWMPVDNAPATLLFLHGGSSNRDSRYFKGLEFYRAMTEAGISVAAIDLRNHGTSDGDGNGLQFGRTEQFDARALVNWARTRWPDQPLFLMGISMGGATAIRAVHEGADIDGLILLDSLLDTRDAFVRGVWAASGLPPALLAPSAWSAIHWHGFPGDAHEPLALALQLDLPILAIQDPSDPVTRAQYAQALADGNNRVELWMAPDVTDDHPELADKGRWGSHVGAFALYPDDTVTRLRDFMDRHSPH